MELPLSVKKENDPVEEEESNASDTDIVADLKEGDTARNYALRIPTTSASLITRANREGGDRASPAPSVELSVDRGTTPSSTPQ